MAYNNILSIKKNEMLDAGAYRTISGTPTLMTDLIKASILADYANGVMSASQKELACTDLYYISGAKALTFANGEILKVGDIVRVDKDNVGTSISYKQSGAVRYFKVTGRAFSKTGVPLLALTYQEII